MESKFRNFFKVVAVMAATGIAGCGSSDDFFVNASETALRVLHGVSDAPRVNVYLNDEQVLSDVDFRTGTGFLTIDSGTYDVRVEAIVPGGNVDVISVEGLELEEDVRTTVLAVGNTAAWVADPMADDAIMPLPVANPTEAIGAGNLRLQVTHASPEAPPVYLLLTDPDLPVDQATPLGPLSYTETTDALEVPGGVDYRVRVAVGTPNPGFTEDDVVFDSGALSLDEGLDLHIVAVTSTVSSQSDSPSPISLVVLTGEGSFDIFDAATGADLRVVHNSSGADAVDVIVDDNATPANEALEIVSDLEFTQFEGFFEPAVAPTEYQVSVVLSDMPSMEVLNFPADLMAGQAYTVIANDVVSNITEWVLVDDNRRVATEAKVRLVHGSPAAGTVDIYVIPSAAMQVPADIADPTFPSVPFGAETGFVGLVPDTYDIYVTGEGLNTPAITALGIEVEGNGIYTAIARDPAGEETGLGLILLDDFEVDD